MVPADAERVLRQQRDGCRAGEDPPTVRAPPVAVLGSRNPQYERDAVSRKQGARRPNEQVLPARDDPYFERRRRRDGDEDLGDREPEVERDLTEDLQRDDHGRQVQAWIATARENDRIGVDRESPLGRKRSVGSHGRSPPQYSRT